MILRTIVFLLCVSYVASATQRSMVNRDPMTDAEIDQMREARDNPPERVELMLKIIQKRVDQLDTIRNDPKAVKPEERGDRLHDLLADITNLTDEFDDNVETFLKERADIRKALRKALTQETATLQKLQAIQQQDVQKPQFSDYSFPLQDAVESVTQSITSTKESIDDDEKLVKDAKRQQPRR